jgi:hypothetical protein
MKGCRVLPNAAWRVATARTTYAAREAVTDAVEHFTCAYCHGIFAKNWTDAEALAEYESVAEWRSITDPPAVLCDTCYQQAMAWAESVGLPVPR